MPNQVALQNLITANPINEGESSDAYVARIKALGLAAVITELPSSPDTMAKLRTLDWLFDAAAVQTIVTNWDGAITALTGSSDPAQQAAGAQLQRTRTYMAGTGPTDGIDVSDAGVRAKVSAMVPGVLTQEQADAINALGSKTTYAVAPDLTDDQVSAAITYVTNRTLINAGHTALTDRNDRAYMGLPDPAQATLDAEAAAIAALKTYLAGVS